ncbi:transcription-repair coupling factor [Chloroflexota bacterium]
MELTQLLRLSSEMQSYGQLAGKLQQPEVNTSVAVLDAARPYIIAALYHRLRRPLLVITARPENSRKLYEQLTTWIGDSQVRLFPEPDTLPYQRVAADTSTELERIRTLAALTSILPATDGGVVIASALALTQKLTPHNEFTSAGHTITPGISIEPFRLLSRWEAMGYRTENIVEVAGTVSHRGGIIDIYPPTSDLPVRLEFFGNTIDSIRFFDPAGQRSLETIPAVFITPATELLLPPASRQPELETAVNSLDLSGLNPETNRKLQSELNMLLNRQKPGTAPFYAPLFNSDSILSYLPEDALLLLDEPLSLKRSIEELDAEAGEMRAEKLERGDLPRNFPRSYFTWDTLEPLIEIRNRLAFTGWDTAGSEPAYNLNFTPAPSYAGQLPRFIKKIKQMTGRQHRLIIVSHQASRLAELLEEADVIAPVLTEVKEAPSPGSITLIPASLAGGWIMNDTTHLYTDAEIFGFVKQRRLTKRHPVSRHKLFAEMTPGDYVVHIEHGIARFAGVTTLRTDNTEREYLVLGYAAGDKLYVPTDQVDRVSRYVGAGERPPVLSRLGTAEWTRTKQKAKEAAEIAAEELLTLYASREVVPGISFSRDTPWQQELEASFPYLETPDQMEVLQQIKEDMSRPRPMDRLVCGDVGYGKTEIAVRAAFKAVMDGKQVAMLVPTTVLAQQHFTTFSQRLSAFPINIEALSRFRTPREQETVLDGLANGSVDICIGTHRLLQKDVAFKDLGLLIIDEEQRFGVAHKEYLKKLKREVDVLTLSATPIPRTLHMSLVSVRDMSTMETPPEERLPVKTFVAEYDDRLVREAVLRELERNGQVFFIHNRVQSIVFIAGKLQILVPEANVAVAHGRMKEDELETVMAEFARGKTDILVCTTIIESGLDMPNVNTLIVNNADRFGLTQLYQLRGRIGRGASLAYAYFLYDKGKRLTPTAEKRLKTIFEASALGSGFGIAMKDLEIRGAGNLLGMKQSGHISAVGFSLYCRLLSEAVEEQKAHRDGTPREKAIESRLPPPAIDLPLPTFIPEKCVADLNTRLSLYQKLATVTRAKQLDDIAREFKDRFGSLPPEVNNLLYAIRIKLLAARAGIESIATEGGKIAIRRFQGLHFDQLQLEPVPDGIKIGHTRIILNPRKLGTAWQGVLEEMVRRVG